MTIFQKNFRQKPVQWFMAAVGLIFLLAGCSPQSIEDDQTAATATPMPADTVGDGMQIIRTSACRIIDLPVIQTNIAQGDLLAWAPDAITLAYVAPVGREWGWYTGDLVLYPLGDETENATRDIKVSGDLTWSPDGRMIGFIAFRLLENRFTVMVMNVATGEITDLYGPTALTDEFSSRKGILTWRDSQNIQVAERCGIDCLRIVEHTLGGGGVRTLEELRINQDTSLDYLVYQPGISPHPNWFNANWSPDGGLVFFADRNQEAWVADLARESRFPLDGAIRRPLETKWSFDSRYLAVRTAERIYLYDMICP